VSLTYEQIQARLEQIEDDLGHRQFEFEQAAEEKHKLARDYELRYARALVAAQGDSLKERQAAALLAIAAADDDIYQRHLEAEGKYEGLKAVVRVLEQRATIGMSLLKAHTRETPNLPSPAPVPEWSGAR
jgi:hypothetical protein